MNKKILIFNNILFISNAIMLFSCYTNIINFSFLKLFFTSLIVLILFIINFIQIKKKNTILEDKKYNIMFLVVNVIVLVIFLRDMFDPMLVMGSNYAISFFNDGPTGSLFIDYNMLFITTMYSGILLYNLLNKGTSNE